MPQSPPLLGQGLKPAGAAMAPALVSRGLIGVVSFLTLVDLFAAQAILPRLAVAYKVSPSEMGLAVNASTLGMAVSGLLVALFSSRIDRRRGIAVSLLLLSVPTLLLAFQPALPVFAALRIVQGVLMAAAFTLTVAYISEHATPDMAAAALAAYVTGNVASNLFGRLLSAAVSDQFGLATNFGVLASLNILGATLVFLLLDRSRGMVGAPAAASAGSAMQMANGWRAHFANPPLVALFGIGFLILFAFIGTFTYVNFVLMRPPLALGQMSLGFVYFVFAPSLLLTPIAGRIAIAIGPVKALIGSLSIAIAGLPLLLRSSLTSVLIGLTLVAAGTFAAQAIATGFVGRIAAGDKGSAGGLYLASYYLGGLVGSAILGRLFDASGWPAAVAAIAAALVIAVGLTWYFVAGAMNRSTNEV